MPLLLLKLLLGVMALYFSGYSFSTSINVQGMQNRVTSTQTFTLNELGWSNAITLNGYQPSYTLYLPISSLQRPQKATLHLQVSFSPYLGEQTQLEIKFNNILLRKITLPADLNQTLNLDLDLPLTNLTQDWQSLTLSAHLAGSENLCSSDLWIYPSPLSTLTVTSAKEPFNGTLNQMPGLFINTVGSKRASLVLVLPPKPSLAEFKYLFTLAFYLGQQSPDSTLNLEVKPIDKLSEENKKNNLILLGTTQQLSALNELSHLNTNKAFNKAQQSQSGLLLLDQSPFNAWYGLLILSGKDNQALRKAVSAFSVPELGKLVNGTYALINQVHVTPLFKPSQPWFQSSLKQLGYTTQTVRGLGRHTQTYTIQWPNDKTPESATMTTYISAPSSILVNNSQITLMINGIRQATFKLTQENSAWNVAFNTHALKPGLNTLTFLIDLHIDKERCTAQNFDQVWLTIYAESEVKASFLETFPQATLSQLPVPFSQEINVLFPTQLSAMDIKNMTHLSFKFGQLIKNNATTLNFLSSEEVDEQFIRNNNILLYGQPEKNPWIEFAFQYLPFELNNQERILKTPNTSIKVNATNSTGLLELTQSPWHANKAVLLVTGTNEVGLTHAVKQLTTNKTLTRFNGNIAIINSDETVEVLHDDEIGYMSLQKKFIRYISNQSKNLWFYIKNNIQTLIYIFVFLVPIIIVIRQRKK